MVFIYAECRQVMRAAVRLYARKYPDRQTPARSVFANIIITFKDTGSVANTIRQQSKTATGEQNSINILAAVAHNPHVNTRQIEHESGVSPRSLRRILHSKKLHSSTFHIISSFMAVTSKTGYNFPDGVQRQLQFDDMFLAKVLFTDEATFTNNGQVNLRNMHYYPTENPHWQREVYAQRPSSVNVWCGLISNQILGPYFVDGT